MCASTAELPARGRLPFAVEDKEIAPGPIAVARGLASGCVPMDAVPAADRACEMIVDAAGAKPSGRGFIYPAHPAAAAPEVLAPCRAMDGIDRIVERTREALDPRLGSREIPGVLH